MHTLRAGLLGATTSGAPSTAIALARGDDPLAAARAAGTLLGKPTLVRAAVAHVAISLGWTAVLARILPRRRPVAWGAAAGLGIAAVDLGVVGRRYPAVRALPQLPQYLDHVAFGVVVAVALRGWRSPPPGGRRTSPGPRRGGWGRARSVSRRASSA